MVISSEFRMRQHRDDDHREDAPYFICQNISSSGIMRSHEVDHSTSCAELADNSAFNAETCSSSHSPRVSNQNENSEVRVISKKCEFHCYFQHPGIISNENLPHVSFDRIWIIQDC